MLGWVRVVIIQCSAPSCKCRSVEDGHKMAPVDAAELHPTIRALRLMSPKEKKTFHAGETAILMCRAIKVRKGEHSTTDLAERRVSFRSL